MMPVYHEHNDEGVLVPRYDWPATRFEWTSAMYDTVRSIRSEASRLLNEVSSIKELKRDQLRTQKATNLVVGAFEVVGWVGSKMWPVELASELDWIASRMENTANGN